MEYLKSNEYYNDLYDLFTIKGCLDYKRIIKDIVIKPPTDPKLKSIKEVTVSQAASFACNLQTLIIKTERYKNKVKHIQEWIERDKSKQELCDNAKPPIYYCPTCNVKTKSTFKSLNTYLDKPSDVLFFMKCPNCKKSTAVYQNGELWEPKPNLCPKCKNNLITSYKRKNNVITTTNKCSVCDYKLIESEDINASHLEHIKKENEDKELLKKYRSEYCFNDKDGTDMLLWFDNVERLSKSMEEQQKQEKDPIYQKARSLKKLKVSEVKKLLSVELEKDGYINLQFEKPEIDKFVIVHFVVEDNKSDREEYTSTNKLKKTIKNTLENTNWRLMSEGVSYRVGYVKGRLKCYEREEDLIKIINKL